MSLSIQELDAMWNKYYAEYNRTPNSHHQLMAFAKATGTPLKFLDARKYFDMRKDDKMKPQSSQKRSSIKRTSGTKFSRNSKKNKNKKKKEIRHRRNSSLPLTETTPNIGILSASNAYKKNDKKKAKHKKDRKEKKNTKDKVHKKSKKTDKKDKKKRKPKDGEKKKKTHSKSKKGRKIKEANPRPKAKKIDPNAWIKDKNEATPLQSTAAAPKKKVVEENAWRKQQSSETEPKPNKLPIGRPTSPKKKTIHSWVKDTNPSQPAANIQARPPPKKLPNAWFKDADSKRNGNGMATYTNTQIAAPSQKKAVFTFGKAPIYQKPPVSEPPKAAYVRPAYAVPTPPGKTRAKVGFKNHNTSPDINEVNAANTAIAVQSSQKKKVVFNDDDGHKPKDKTRKKKKKTLGYLSFFGRKKAKKKQKAEHELTPTPSPQTSASDLSTPIQPTRSLSISQSDTENVHDDNCKAGSGNADAQQMRLTDVQSDPMVKAPIVGNTDSESSNKRSGSVFSRLRSTSKGDETVELEQLKKIRKHELRQLNNLKKEHKSLRDKFNKVSKEKKTQTAQIKQLKDTVKRKESELNDIQKDLEHMRRNNGELIHKFNDSETKNKKLDNTLTAKNNEVRVLRKDANEYKRQIVQLMDLQNQNDKKIFASLQTQNESLQEEVHKNRKEIEELNNKQIDYDNLCKANAKLNKDKDETKKKYLYFKDKLDKTARDKNNFESDYVKEVENKVFLEKELNDLQAKFEMLQRKHFELGKSMETEINVLREQHELDKEMDQNIIAEQQRQLSQLQDRNRTQTQPQIQPMGRQGSVTMARQGSVAMGRQGSVVAMTNQQNWEHQQRLYQQEQFRRQQQWIAYQQQQQQQQQMYSNQQLNEKFPPPPPEQPGPPPVAEDNMNGLPHIDEAPVIVARQSESVAGSVVINEDAKTTKTYYEDGSDSRFHSDDSEEVDDEYSGDSGDDSEDDSEYSGDSESESESESESHTDDGLVNTGYEELVKMKN